MHYFQLIQDNLTIMYFQEDLLKCKKYMHYFQLIQDNLT